MSVGRTFALLGALVLVTAAPVSAADRSAASAPIAPLPMLPSVARVRVDVGAARLLVTEDVNLPRGDWRGEPLDFYVAFGAPGLPRAIDVHLIAMGDGMLEAPDDAPSETLPFERAPRRPRTAHPLLGRDSMAGIVVHLGKDALSRAFGPGNMAQIRVRTALDVTSVDPLPARSLVVRLGASRGTPLTLGRVQIVAAKGGPEVTAANARLCGPEADPQPLAISGMRSGQDRVAPVLAVRHASDDLCLNIVAGRP